MTTIVTHTNPDFDAIASAWLLKRYLLPDSQILFVNTGAPDPAVLESADAVVDTGRAYDARSLRFDHHQFPGAIANETCAARQVFQYLLNQGLDVAHLRPLIDLVYQGDTGKPGANQSRQIGLHALLSGFKAFQRLPDAAVYARGAEMLDLLDTWLRKQLGARAELAEKTVYKSEDGAVWAIRHGSVSSSFAAMEEGAQIIVFEARPREVDGGTTYGVGITRAQESTIDVGEMATAVANEYEEFRAELDTWFKHPAGFFAGRGTAKAPSFLPVTIDIAELARAFDDIWQRS